MLVSTGLVVIFSFVDLLIVMNYSLIANVLNPVFRVIVRVFLIRRLRLMTDELNTDGSINRNRKNWDRDTIAIISQPSHVLILVPRTYIRTRWSFLGDNSGNLSYMKIYLQVSSHLF